MQTLEGELRDAKAQERHIRRKIGNLKPAQLSSLEAYRERRKQLQDAHKEVVKRLTLLQTEHDKHKIATTIANTKKMLKDNLTLLRIEKNGRPLEVTDNLEVTTTFTNCQHEKQYPLDALIPFTNERLWQDIIKDGLAITMTKNCEQCRAEKQHKRKTWGRYDDKPIGSATLIVRALH
jgi:hypothetical protein